MFMVEYEPGGVAQPHDHPLEETYYVLEGEVVAMRRRTRSSRSGRATLRPAWDAFTPSQPQRTEFGSLRRSRPSPRNYSYRFNRDWVFANRIDRGS